MKGLIFYLDAIMALLLALVVVSGIGIYYSIEPELQYKTMHAEAEDMMQLLSQDLNASKLGLPENYSDKSYLEVIGTLWLNSNATEAGQVAADVLDEFDRRCMELSFEGEVIYNRTGCDEAGRSVAVANRVASGYTPGKKPDGYMTRVLLNRERKVTSDYLYFGGYEGDGNITKKMRLAFVDSVMEAKMELDTGSNFTLYVNGNYSGQYSPSQANMSGDSFWICNATDPAYCSFFQENNTLDFVFNSLNSSYIGGGYLMVRYNTTELEEIMPLQKYEFPGLKGVINIYSSFYVPGNLQQMSAFLHYTSNYTIFMNLGNVTIYTGSTPEDTDMNFTINSTEIGNALSAEGMSYSDLSNRTIPLRLGMQNVSYITIGYDAADVFSVTDLSGSMLGGKMTSAKDANYVLTDIILNESVNRLGLVGYETSARDSDFHHLTNESQSLKDLINYTWDANGWTCICCGINKAVQNFRFLPVAGESRLMAYLRFENDYTDESGEGNDGTPYNGPTFAAGINGSAVELDGDNDYLRILDDDTLGNSGMDGLTFSMWIYPREDSDYMSLGGTTDDWDGDGYNLYLRGGQADQEYAFTIDDNYVRAGNIVKDMWHHLAGTYNGSLMVLYLDGSPIGQGTDKSGRIDNNDRDLYIGRIRGSSMDYFNGSMDELRVYDRALNLTEIQALASLSPSCGNNATEIGEACDGTFKTCQSGGNNGKRDCSGCNFDPCDTTAVCGDGILNSGEECDDGNTNNSDSCSAWCTFESEWYRSLIVMSDGNANVECAEQGFTPDLNNNSIADDAGDDAIQAACDAYANYGMEFYAVGFGSDVDETTLRNIADCGHGEYYFSDVTELEDIYKLIAAQILNASYEAQTVKVFEGDYGNITLYPDSYINFTYVPATEQPQYGEIAVKVEGPRFGGTVESPKNGTFVVPNETRVLDAKITSYSSQYWTDRAMIDNGTDMEYIYRLWNYRLEYKNLGDPYVVYIPIGKISGGLNNVSIDTGGRQDNATGGSPDDRVIYTLAVNILSDYGGVFNKTQGSKTEFYYDLDLDGTQDGSIELTVGNESDPWDPGLDAIDNAVMKLMDKLNFYGDTGTDDGSIGNPIDVYPGEFSFDTIPIGGIPWLWGPGIFTLKVW